MIARCEPYVDLAAPYSPQCLQDYVHDGAATIATDNTSSRAERGTEQIDLQPADVLRMHHRGAQRYWGAAPDWKGDDHVQGTFNLDVHSVIVFNR
jgi:hypothetical protein